MVVTNDRGIREIMVKGYKLPVRITSGDQMDSLVTRVNNTVL